MDSSWSTRAKLRRFLDKQKSQQVPFSLRHRFWGVLPSWLSSLGWEQRLGDLARLAQALVHEFGEAPAAAPPLQQLPAQPPGIERAAGLSLGAQRILSGVLLGLGLLLWLPAFFLPAARLGLLAVGGIFVAIGLLHAVHSLLRRH